MTRYIPFVYSILMACIFFTSIVITASTITNLYLREPQVIYIELKAIAYDYCQVEKEIELKQSQIDPEKSNPIQISFQQGWQTAKQEQLSSLNIKYQQHIVRYELYLDEFYKSAGWIPYFGHLPKDLPNYPLSLETLKYSLPTCRDNFKL